MLKEMGGLNGLSERKSRKRWEAASFVKGLKRIPQYQMEASRPWGWPIKGLTVRGTADNGG